MVPLDDLERRHIDATLEWIESGAELCRMVKPATPPMHLVSYFVLVDRERRSLLLVDHKNASLWLPTGGHVEPGEHPADTVRRECREELGIEASFIHPEPFFLTVTTTVGATAGHTDVSLWYLLDGDATRELQFDRDEFHSIQWFDLDNTPTDRTDPHMQRFVRKLRDPL
jgi:8-oxo-dGTP pyrophosphatase MutT (NUDIX family)